MEIAIAEQSRDQTPVATTFYARMLDAGAAGEGSYAFEGLFDLMRKTADEIVAAFFNYVEKDIL